MDANTRDDMIDRYISQAIDELLPNGTGVVSSHRLRHVMRRVAQQSAQTAVGYELLNLLDTAELAELWGVSTRRVRAHCARLHDRWGIGRKANGGWMMTREEALTHRPAGPGRPPNE